MNMRISPYYEDNIKIPRKLKNKIKKYVGVHWKDMTNAQRLWHYMEYINPKFKELLISQIK